MRLNRYYFYLFINLIPVIIELAVFYFSSISLFFLYLQPIYFFYRLNRKEKKMGLKFFCILILGVFACNKVNQWKQPVKVCFNIDLAEEAAVSGTLSFNSGYLNIGSFIFNGKREQGADVYFTKSFNPQFSLILNDSPVNEMSFDLPQGVYSSIDVEVLSGNNNSPHLVVSGIFSDGISSSVPLRFEYNEIDTFIIEGEDEFGDKENIDLAENSEFKSEIWMNPSDWFNSVSVSALKDADLVTFEGEKILLINSSNNTQIYKTVCDALSDDKQIAIFIKKM